MKAKRKIILSVSAFVLIVVATVVSVIAVLAAERVTISSSINVTYTTREVAGTVTAKYQVANGTATNIGTGTVTYNGADETTSTNLTATTLNITTLTSTNKYVDFIFTFTNTGSAAYTATLTPPTVTEADNNFIVSYPTKPSTMISGSNTSFTVAGNTTTAVTYKIRYTIKDVSKTATLSGNFNWALVSANAQS